jgi:putative transposase
VDRSTSAKQWAKHSNIELRSTQPGNPQQNSYVERFNRTVRHEWLNQYLWKDIDQFQGRATRWMWQYDHERSNVAL